ncbi:MAG: diadenylate cyclase CdaA [Clostridia bacterium]|nr:diadenylate cyclase CdaA [Clostridia bacterium]
MGKLLAFLTSYLNVFKITDLFDIALVALAIYWLIKLIKETRAVQLVKGIVMLLILTQISDWLNLNIINFILTNTLQLGVLALIVLFQPELRRVLEQIGTTKIGNIFSVDSNNVTIEDTIKEICVGVENMSRQRIGALIVIERKTKVSDVLLTGVELKSRVSSSVLVNIFFPNTPLHDGAVVIRDNKIEAAGCLLPLTQNNTLSTELGTRHRAAIGMSETSDALVIVVSEETGKISLANGGTLTRNFNAETLKKALEKLLIISDEHKQSKFSKFKGRTK